MIEYRGYSIVNDDNSPLKRVEAVGRGSVHLSLRGYYTSIGEAKKAVDTHIIQKGGSDA